jgi:hypothetical protein
LLILPGSLGDGDSFGAAPFDLVSYSKGCLAGAEVFVGDSAAHATGEGEVLATTAVRV